MKNLKTADKIMIAVVLVIALGLLGYYQMKNSKQAEQVVIELNGQVIKTFQLPQKESQTYKVEVSAREYNIVQIEGNRVRVSEANCPEQLDVKEGWIDKPGEALICLPHKLAIKIEGKKSGNAEDNGIDIKTF